MNPKDIQAEKIVFHRGNPGRLGVLTGQTLRAISLMAEVDWGSSTEFVDSSCLESRSETSRATIDSEVSAGRYGTIDDLQRRITYEKLRGMLSDVFYSMKTSEIDFYPHQFKPVIRFIESATNRLLIADEVGLGKTIEAGLIWTEWQAREKARRLLVICPPTLVPKWLRELQDRFQINAEATNARQLLDLFHRFSRQGPSVNFALVASYHALRPVGKERLQLDALSDEDESVAGGKGRFSARVNLLHAVREQADNATQVGGPRFLDMVVLDEAHLMKNTATETHFAGELFSKAASAVVCLSATPVHNQSRDLYALLRLIDPEVFRDEFVFDLLRHQNLAVVRLQNALAADQWNIPGIKSLIAGLDNPEARSRLEAALVTFDGSPQRRVALRHDVERMNLLNNFINRTRKRDVIENRVIRQPVTRTVKMSRAETIFYRAVLDLVRRAVRAKGEFVTSFHLISPALYMSSCLPAVAQSIRNGKWGGFEELEQLAEDFEDHFDLGVEDDLTFANELRALVEHDFEAEDTKYAALVEALRHIAADGSLRSAEGREVKIAPSEKVIIFAFFKGTIAYLQRRLSNDGFNCLSVTGDIKDRVERDRLLRGFEHDRNQILLCSEIGAEGVDLQFARVIVNYDLPWNPMRVEQRIGRIDRIGQLSSSIVIINFQVLDTIDGNIYAHLYARIGIFESSIGALEGILGEQVSFLTREILQEELSQEQIAARVAQTAETVCQRAQIESELEQSTASLIAFQDLISEQIGESHRLGRFIKPDELRRHAEDFFAHRYTGREACRIVRDNPEDDCLEFTFSFQAMSDFEDYCKKEEQDWPVGFSQSTRRATITFEPATHQKCKRAHRQLVLVTHLHPFFRWITQENSATNNRWHKVSALRVTTDIAAPGQYLYLIHRSTLEGITKRDTFHYAMKATEGDEVILANEAEALLNAALEDGESLPPTVVRDLSADLLAVRSALEEELRQAQEIFRLDQKQKLDIRQQQLSAHFNRRIETQKRRIATAEVRDPKSPGLRGFRVTLANLHAQMDAQIAKLQGRADSIMESAAEIACGIIQVEPVESAVRP